MTLADKKARQAHRKHKKFIAKVYRTKFGKARLKILRLKDANKKEKWELIEELGGETTNEDLLDVLVKDEFNTVGEYFASINNYLSFEAATYSYDLPKYQKGNLDAIMKLITGKHNLESLRERIGL